MALGDIFLCSHAEHPCCFKILLQGDLEETCRFTMSHSPGLSAFLVVLWYILKH